jgi:hypothetical protein
LWEHVEKDLAAILNIGKPDCVEERRAKWTTFSNIHIYFDSLQAFFVFEGAAEKKTIRNMKARSSVTKVRLRGWPTLTRCASLLISATKAAGEADALL